LAGVRYHELMEAERIPVVVNGVPREARPGTTILDLIGGMGGHRPGIAVAVNDQVIRRDAYSRVALAAGDRIEIIHAVGGG
jgi:sulfur carrier protein